MNFCIIFRRLKTCTAIAQFGMKLSRVINRSVSVSSPIATFGSPRSPFCRALQDIACGFGVLGAGLVTVAVAEGDQGVDHVKGKSYNDQGNDASDWIKNRLQSDICHLAPGISEVLLDILDLLQENCDNYVRSINKRVNQLHGSLQKYGSTLSLNLTEQELENSTPSDPGSQEIQKFKQSYRKVYQQCSGMVTGLEKFLTSAQTFGAKSCIEKCHEEMEEVVNLLESIEKRVHDYESKLFMAEKHFHTKRRRAGSGQGKML